MFDFPKTIPVPRGCGEREPGGMYAECGLSSGGRPLEDFLVDPPQPLPEGKGKAELANKPQLWVRTARRDAGDPATEYVVMHPGSEQPIVDLILWIGEEHYPYLPDYIEEVRRYGASRKLNPNLDLSQLTRYSRMILAHPKALNTLWEEQQRPHACAKALAEHAMGEKTSREAQLEQAEDEEEWGGEETVFPQEQQATDHLPTGPCLFKCYELIPVHAAQDPPQEDREEPLCLREIGSTLYSYRPTGEDASGLRPGVFATLPITGFALIQFGDGTVNERAKGKLEQAKEQNQALALPYYESDR